ncbi:MAG TPA: hypothetical protein VF678_09080 [bacterium]
MKTWIPAATLLLLAALLLSACPAGRPTNAEGGGGSMHTAPRSSRY